MNFFPSIPPSTNPHELRNQRISTIIFIILFTLSLSILILYNAFVVIHRKVTVNEPTFTQYSNLFSNYPSSLECPCSKSSIKYEVFFRMNFTLHQLCSSDLISDKWLDQLILTNQQYKPYTFDFLSLSLYLFPALRNFCTLVKETISYNLIDLYSTEYVSTYVMASNVFQAEIQKSIDGFILSTTKEFVRFLKMIRETTQANALSSALQLNYYYYEWPDYYYLYSYPMTYSNCSCSASALCFSVSCIYNTTTQSPLFCVPGFYVGCYIIESLLYSNLECFFDQECLDKLHYYVQSQFEMPVAALNQSLLYRYQINSTIEEILNHLMVEQWNLSILFENYYEKCHPMQCTYDIDSRNDVVYIATILIGLLGGLTTMLKFIVPKCVQLVTKFFTPHHEQIGK